MGQAAHGGRGPARTLGSGCARRGLAWLQSGPESEFRQLRRAALVAILVLPMSTLTADDPDAGRAQSVEPEATLRKLGEQYVAAFNQHDAQTIANFWSPNAVYINRLSGAQVTGREAIAAQFKALFASQPEAKLQVRVDSIQLVSPNVAVEKGVSTLVATTPV